MRTFKEITQDAGLIKFLDSSSGTLYFQSEPLLRGAPSLMVRHFDRDLPPELVPAFAELTAAAQRWVLCHPAVARYVWVEQPSEVGRDFIARPHHVYYTSIASYDEPDEPDDPLEPPKELSHMRAAFRNEIGRSHDHRDVALEKILGRSLLAPTAKTYLGTDGRFVIVELKPTRTELEERT